MKSTDFMKNRENRQIFQKNRENRQIFHSTISKFKNATDLNHMFTGDKFDSCAVVLKLYPSYVLFSLVNPTTLNARAKSGNKKEEKKKKEKRKEKKRKERGGN